MATTTKHLRVCTTVVTTDGQCEAKSNEARCSMATQLMEQEAKNIDLLVLPAGYLRARSEDEVRGVAAPVIDGARALGVAVIVGVDVERPRLPSERRVKDYELPYFLVAWAPGYARAEVWRQRSATGADAAAAPADRAGDVRALEVRGKSVAAIACGEVFSPLIRESIASAKPKLAVLAAHSASGARHWSAQRCLARLGVPSVRSVHAAGGSRDVLYGAMHERGPVRNDRFGGITASVFSL
jgi:hypothetical protein